MNKIEIQTAINNLISDTQVPKNIKNRLGTILQDLSDNQDLNLKVNRSLSELDDISNDINLPSFVRTELFGVLSLLENMNTQLITVKATVKKKQLVHH